MTPQPAMTADSPSTARPALHLIAALSRNRCIGRDNALPWRLPDDLKRFKALTMGAPILMGRKTWESLGRPLPGRLNLVLSRDPAWSAEGAVRVDSIDDALARCDGAPAMWVIGGGQIYAQALPLAVQLHLTEVHADVDGDTWFPPVDPQLWQASWREPHAADERHALPFDFVTYERRS